jgi:HPt (histidine-containing phosphotransfer) domain-containing protein
MVLDRAHFDMMTGADRALQLEVLALFRTQAQAWAACFAAGAAWREAVHTMKGAARGIGLAALAAACEALERAPEAESAAGLEHVRRALEEALLALEQFAAEAA